MDSPLFSDVMGFVSSHGFRTLVGGGVVLSLFALFSFSYMTTTTQSLPAHQYRVTASFRSADGLNSGAEVLLAGVPIGRVTGLTLSSSQREATVRMVLDTRYPLPTDSTAQILTHGFFGKRYVGVIPGGESDVLRDGDAFDYVQSAISLQALFQNLTKKHQSRAPTSKKEQQP